MRSYLNGTWSAERDSPLPAAAAVDSFMQRYGWTWDEYQDTPEDVLQELEAIMAGEADHYRDQKALSDAKQAAQDRRSSGGGGPRRPAPPDVAQTGGIAREAWEQGFPLPGSPDPLLGA